MPELAVRCRESSDVGAPANVTLSPDMTLKPLGRLPFFVSGALLSLLKVGADFGIARAFARPFSLLYYVSPVDAPLFHPGESYRFYAAMWACALPFIAVGVWLTAQRLMDAALNPFLALLFFVPFANLLFIALVTAAPPRPIIAPQQMPPQDAYRQSGQAVSIPVPTRSPGALLFMSAGMGTVIGLGALALSVGLFKEYGAALMLGAPTISGFATGAFYARLDPSGKFQRAALATLVTCMLTLGVIMVFAVEGAVCLVMALPLLVIPAFVGAYIGFAMARSVGAGKVPKVIAASILSLPGIFALEHVSPLPPLAPPPVTTEIIVDAPPERVFPNVVRVSEMPAPTELLFRVGVAYPLRATMDDGTSAASPQRGQDQEDRVGATRRCEFNTGTAMETVTRFEAPNHFAFHIDSQPDPLREQTLYHTVRQPHLNGYVRNQEGIFDLEELPGGKTRVRAQSIYTVAMGPETYWRLWTDASIHAIHGRVLEHIKEESERRGRKSLASR